MNECVSGSHRCSPFASCHNNNGSYQCQCINTYTGDGKTCRGNVKKRTFLTSKLLSILHIAIHWLEPRKTSSSKVLDKLHRQNKKELVACLYQYLLWDIQIVQHLVSCPTLGKQSSDKFQSRKRFSEVFLYRAAFYRWTISSLIWVSDTSTKAIKFISFAIIPRFPSFWLAVLPHMLLHNFV